MTPIRGLVQSVKGWLGKPMATPESDPQRYFGNLMALPNPDPILRQMGQSDRVYNSIMADAHVIGEIRSIRGSFRSHQYRLQLGGEDDSQALAAMELCEDWMRSQPPNAISDWLEVMWQMASSILFGHRVHEVVWALHKGNYLPSQVIDRPGRRFRFNAHGELLLLTKENLQGEPVQPFQFVVSRNMPTHDNPYGLALLSSCFWPWTFKTGGWRYFVKYCERHGLPWPIGRYPQGSSEAEQDALAEALAGMVDAGYVVAQEGTGIELLVPTSSGSNLPQQNLITLCNREMSKALTSQAMIGEQLDVGARAASETAKDRQGEVHDSDRDIAASSMAQIFKWITLFNFGPDVAPPTLEFFRQENQGKERAETYQLAANMGARPSKSAMLDELGIPQAEDDDDALLPAVRGAPKPPAKKPDDPLKPDKAPAIDFTGIAGFEFAKAAGMTEDEAMQLAADAADAVIEDKMIAPIATMLAQYEADGKTLQEFKADLEQLVGQLDDEALREVCDRALSYSLLRGAATGAA